MFPRLKGRVVKGYPHIVVGDEVPSKLIKLDSPVESEVENIGDDQTITPGSQHLDSTSDACDDDSFPRLVPPTGVTPGTPLEMRDGSCPQVMHLSPVDTHVLLRQATVVWAVVYQDVLDENKLERAIARALSSYPELAGTLGNLIADMKVNDNGSVNRSVSLTMHHDPDGVCPDSDHSTYIRHASDHTYGQYVFRINDCYTCTCKLMILKNDDSQDDFVKAWTPLHAGRCLALLTG